MKHKISKQTLQVMKDASWYNNWVFSIIKPYLGNEILEVGSGIGVFTKMLVKVGRVNAIDISKDYIKKLRKDFVI